ILKDLALLFAYRTPMDPAGEVEAEIREKAAGKNAEVEKKKLRYRGKLARVLRILKSEHRIRKELSFFAGIEGTRLGGIETESKYQMKQVAGHTGSSHVNPQLALQFPVLPIVSSDVTAAERPVVSWKILKSELARVGKLRSARRMKLFHEIIRTLKQDPRAL